MKKIIYICVILFFITHLSFAQNATNLTRVVLATVPENLVVNDGEFQVNLHKSIDFKETGKDEMLSYVYLSKNKFVDKDHIVVNGWTLTAGRTLKIRPYRVAAQQQQCVFVMKNMDKNADDIGYGMEVVRAYGVPHPLCDTVVHINDDGYVYRSGGKYSYSEFTKTYNNQPKVVPVVWLERKVYDSSKKASLSRLSKGDVYYESPDGHYYYLYRDEYMPYTVLVVDDKVVELFGQYSEDDFELKFSYNGKHWMAVGRECYWVDGDIKSVKGYVINDFLITNDGHYSYKASLISGEDRGEVVVVDGQVIRRNAKVCYYGLNENGRLKFRFITEGRTIQYEEETTTDVSEEMVSVYYPDDPLKGQTVTVLSNDGLHKLTYKKGLPSVEIDGVKVAASVPCYAIFDEYNSMFIWNAVEEQNGRQELVIYRYPIVNNFFKKMFK